MLSPYWCCEDCGNTNCQVRPICTPLNDGNTYHAEYISVGRPKPPVNFPGTYWAAWHNTISKKGRLGVDLEMQIVKRTLVNTGGCGGACGTPTTGLGTALNCATNGTLGATPRCARTVYTDNFIWNYEDKLDFVGVSKEQRMEVDEETGEEFIRNPPGRLPCALGVPCDPTFTCANLNSAYLFTDPAWWANENRKVLPVFQSTEPKITTSTTINSSFPQISACGQIQWVNRCSFATTEENADVCIHYPNVVLPSYGGERCDGLTSPCDQTIPQNGTDNWWLGIDIISQQLEAKLSAFNIPLEVGIGTWNNFWVCRTAGRLRLLFDGRPLTPTAGSVWKGKDSVVFSKNATLDIGTASYNIDIKLTLSPESWCYQEVECRCGKSWCEHGPSTLHMETEIPLDDVNICVGQVITDTHLPFSINVGLETCYRPLGTIGWNSCYNWDDLPYGNSYAGDPAFILNTFRFLGAAPVERGHPYWVKYRQRYNHTETLNPWYQRTHNDPTSICAPSRSGDSIDLGPYQFWINAGEAYPANTSACQAQCAPGQWCCSCGIPAGINTNVAGCYGVKVGGSYDVCDYTAPYCDRTCSGCANSAGTSTNPATALPRCGNCGTFSIPLETVVTCQAFLGCSNVNKWFDHSMIFNVCANATYDVCGLVALSGSAGFTKTIGAPDTWIWESWEPSKSCTPLGTWSMKRSSFDTVCDGPSAWLGGATLIVT